VSVRSAARIASEPNVRATNRSRSGVKLAVGGVNCLTSAVNGSSGQSADSPGTAQHATPMGLALLLLWAKPDWVHRRIMQLEFVDAKTAGWRINLDFFIPSAAPTVRFGGELVRLVPVTSLLKGEFTVMSQYDGHGRPVWQPTTEETAQHLAAALGYMASDVLGIKLEQLPEELSAELARIVSARPHDLRSKPPTLLAAGTLIDEEQRYYPAVRERLHVEDELQAVRLLEFGKRRELRRQWATAYRVSSRAWDNLRRARANWELTEVSLRDYARRLMENTLFRSQVEELARNVVQVIGVTGRSGARRNLEFTYQGSLTFQHPASWFVRLLWGLGWRSWPLALLTGGGGGSQQLQVTTPSGAEILGITVRPTVPGTAGQPVKVPGGTTFTTIPLPAGSQVRYQATIYARVARPGWLTASWLVAIATSCGMIIGRYNLPYIYSPNGGIFSPNSAIITVLATDLPALLGVFTVLLVAREVHPFVARLLLPLRLLISLDFAFVLIALGNLLLPRPVNTPMPTALWAVMAYGTVTVAILVTVSWLLPVRRIPHED
jgi:hypothetical protein